MTHLDMDQSLAALLGSRVGAGEPGVAIGVYIGGELVVAATAGCASVEHGAAITEHTAFDIASVSKHMTATCVLPLARTAHRPDADIRRYPPELALVQPVTVRQCPTTRPGCATTSRCASLPIPAAGMTEGRFWHLITGQRELDFAAGAAFAYSNTGYALAAVLVRRVSGRRLAAYARDRVFGPLGMTATCFRDDVSVIVPGLASGYLARTDGAGFARCEVNEDVVGDGAVVTTTADLARWHAFIADGAVLGPDIRDGLLDRAVLTDGTALGYALGLEAIEVAGEAAWWHSGTWAGYRAAVIYVPASRVGVSVLANRDDLYPSHLAHAVAHALRSGAELSSCYDAVRGAAPAPADVARQRAGELAGRWHEPDQDVFIDLREAEPGVIMVREQGAEHAVRLGLDGAWRGAGSTAGASYVVRDGVLEAGWGLSSRPESRYLRAASKPRDGSDAALPVAYCHSARFLLVVLSPVLLPGGF
jgi:CubicO group peptidase (beta-lactamase class C family)